DRDSKGNKPGWSAAGAANRPCAWPIVRRPWVSPRGSCQRFVLALLSLQHRRIAAASNRPMPHFATFYSRAELTKIGIVATACACATAAINRGPRAREIVAAEAVPRIRL